MAYVNKPRPYKKEYQQQLDRGGIPNKLERQKARRKLDAKGVDRAGKDVAHVKALSKGGSNATYLSMADEQLANSMAAQGGFGFGKAMAQQMIQQVQAAQLINSAASAVKP